MTQEEFIQDFKQEVVSSVQCYYSEDYRDTREYYDKTLDERYRIALTHWSAPGIIEEILKDYYKKIQEYEELYG